jgi:hypothetical protein
MLIEDLKKHLFFLFFRVFFLMFLLCLDEWNDAQQIFDFFDVKTIENKINHNEFQSIWIFFESTQDFIDFARDANFFSSFLITIETRLFLFWDEKFESHVAQKLLTSSSTIINFSRNFFFLWTISHFFKFKETNDLSNEITKLDSKTKKIKTNKLSIDELTKKQIKEHEVKTISFSILDFFFSLNETTQTIDFHSRNFLKSKKKSKTQQTQKRTTKKELKSNHKIHNRNKRFSTQRI